MSTTQTNLRQLSKADVRAINAWARYAETEAAADLREAEFWTRTAERVAADKAEFAAYQAKQAEAAAAASMATTEAPTATAPAKAEKARCPHYAAIKQFFAVARAKGFDTTTASQDRWRGAIGVFLGRAIRSRSELNGAEWQACTAALENGVLFI